MNPAYHRDLFHRIRELTIRTVESMPPDKIFFKPENSRTFAEIVLHVVESQYHILNKIADRDDRPPQALSTDNYSTREALAGLLRDEQARTREILGGLTAEALAEVVPSPFGDGDLCVRDSWVEILILHEVDHKGNLVIMAKCCGADPPDVVRLSKEEAGGGN